MDFESRQLTVRGQEVHLTPKEFDVLKHLIANQGKPLTHRRLLQSVWGPDYGEETENLRVVINQLRKKIESNLPSRRTYGQSPGWDTVSSRRTRAWLSHRLENSEIPRA